MYRQWLGRVGLSVAFAAGILVVATARADAQERTREASPLHTGGWIIGGSASLSSSRFYNGDTWAASAQPTGLRFVSPRFALGATAVVSSQSAPSNHSYTLGIGPAARYYFRPDSAERWLPFVGASVSYARSHVRLSLASGDVSDSGNSLTTDESIGITRIVATHVGITGEGYATQAAFTGFDGNTPHVNGYGFRFGITVFIH